MDEWIRLCSIRDAPEPAAVIEAEANGQSLCLANIGGVLHALDNICPHRQGPLGQGWVEGNTVLCPWHAWAFDVSTGEAEEPEKARVRVFPVTLGGDDVLVQLG